MKSPIPVVLVCFIIGAVVALDSKPLQAADPQAPITITADDTEEFDPFAPNAGQVLQDFDRAYESQTGQPSHLVEPPLKTHQPSCYRETCPIYMVISKSQQTANLFVNGQSYGVWQVSTGIRGHTTPDFDTHPDGRIYDRFNSKKFPGGDWQGLGNMPYAVFIEDGFAIHGTPEGNWHRLGTPASHGCIRILPDNAYVFNRLVRQYGVHNTWVVVY